MKNRADILLEKIFLRFFGLFGVEPDSPKAEALIQLVKFCAVGVLNTAVNYAVYALMVLAGVYYIAGSLIAFTVSTANAYFWNDRFVFKSSGRRWRGILKTYCSYALTGIFLYNALLYLLVDICGISELLSPLLVLVVTIPCNFLLNKFWTFRKK